MTKWVDYYKLFEVSNKASNIEIKNAYRKKSKIYHPDVNDDKDCLEIMKQLNDAYEILNNTMKRSKYDIDWDNQNIIISNEDTSKEKITINDKLFNIANILVITSIITLVIV